MTNDSTNTTHITFEDKLYGREKELKLLSETYKKAFQEENQLVLIKGVSGSGKTSLVNAFAEQLDPTTVCFVTGKYDLSRNDQPYATLIQAFNQLIAKWNKLEPVEREKIRRFLKRELGNHLNFILDIFPELKSIIEPNEVTHLDLQVAFKDHFNEAFLKFVNALSFFDKQIVIFLDDLQWADISTLNFLKLWLSEGAKNTLFWIGAFRDNELEEDTWLVNTGILTAKYKTGITNIKLGGLQLDTIEEMYRDVLAMKETRLKSFSELALQLTGGNPLFIKESLNLLVADEVLTYSEDREYWDYNIDKLKRNNHTNRTVDFIIRKMESLDEATQELLAIGAAVGNTFNTAILGAVSDKTPETIKIHLGDCVKNNIIDRVVGSGNEVNTLQFKFRHDKMQNAAYSMLSEEQLMRIHYSIGRTYQATLGHAAQDRNIYDIVNQLNRCIPYFNSKVEQVKLVKLNLQAGQKAKAASSFDQALNYFSVAIGVIESDREEWDQQTIFTIYLESGEAAYLKSDFVSSVMHYESALKYAATKFEKARVHHNFLVMYNGVSDMTAAWDSGIKALDLLGMRLPKKVSKMQLIVLMIKAKWRLRKFTPEKLLNQPDLTDKSAEQILLTLMEMIASAWDKNPEILAYCVLKGFEIILKKGNSPVGYFGVSGYGAIMGLGFGQIEKGWEYVKLGGRLTEKYDSMIFHGRGSFAVHGTYSHIVLHAKENIQPLEDAFYFSKGAGDYNIASYSSMLLVENMRVIGCPIAEIIEKSESYFTFMERTANSDYLVAHKAVVAASKLLVSGPEMANDKVMEVEEKMPTVDFTHVRYTWRIYKLRALLTLGMIQEAILLKEDILNDGYAGLSALEMDRVILLGLSIFHHSRDERNPKKYQKQLKKELTQINKFAKLNPDNYLQISELYTGLLEEIKGDKATAIKHYEKAITAAEKYGFVHNAALFNEHLGRIYLSDSNAVVAYRHLFEAKNNYETWGAAYKVTILEDELDKFYV